jgi:hypothetical protein
MWLGGYFRVASGTLGSAEIEAKFEVAPAVSKDKGSLASPRNPASRVLDKSVCVWESTAGASEPPSAHLAWLRGFVIDHQRQLRELTGECDLSGSLVLAPAGGSMSIAISPNDLQLLAELNVDLTISVQPADS